MCCASAAIVLIQIVVLIAIINESTKITPCERQDDCSPGTFCLMQDISLLSRNLANLDPPTEPVQIDFARRCWDCVYTQVAFLMPFVPGMDLSNLAAATSLMDVRRRP